eukprot:3353220-Alexandrium_andersonii.AAC.1
MSCATIRNRGRLRNWGSARRSGREHPRARTSRPGRPLVPAARSPPRPASTGCWPGPRCG